VCQGKLLVKCRLLIIVLRISLKPRLRSPDFRLFFAAPLGKRHKRQLNFEFMATANDLAAAWRSLQRDIAVVLDMQHRTRAICAPLCSDPPQHPHRQILRRALQLDRENRAGAMITRKMDTAQGRRGLFSPTRTPTNVTLAAELVGDAKIISWKTLDYRDFVEESGVHRIAVERGVDGVGRAGRHPRDSSNNVQKPVTLETGITVQVPLFIKTARNQGGHAHRNTWNAPDGME